MHHHGKVAVRVITLFGLLFSQGAFAEFYLGAGFNSSDLKAENLSGLGSNARVDESDMGWAVSMGYKFGPHFALEAEYGDHGSFNDQIFHEPSLATDTIQIELNTVKVALIGILPLSSDFSVYGKLGAFRWDSTVNQEIVVLIGTPLISITTEEKENSTDIFGGLGIIYSFREQWAIRGEYEYYDWDVGDSDFSMGTWGLKILYSFK